MPPAELLCPDPAPPCQALEVVCYLKGGGCPSAAWVAQLKFRNKNSFNARTFGLPPHQRSPGRGDWDLTYTTAKHHLHLLLLNLSQNSATCVNEGFEDNCSCFFLTTVSCWLRVTLAATGHHNFQYTHCTWPCYSHAAPVKTSLLLHGQKPALYTYIQPIYSPVCPQTI